MDARDFYACPVCNRTSDDPADCLGHSGPVAMEPVTMGDVVIPGNIPEGNLTFELGVSQDRDS